MTRWHTRGAVRLACLLSLGFALVALMVQGPPHGSTSPSVTSRDGTFAVPAPSVGPDPAMVAARTEDRVRARLRETSERVHLAVSVRDEESGTAFDYGSDTFATASLVKVHLAAVMLWRAERDGTSLSAAQRSDVEQMLFRSENDPANRAYADLGGPEGIENGLREAFGSPRIQIGENFRWGHSLTTPRAVVALLDRVLDTERDTPYELMQEAMSRVIPDQRWGVSALADRRTTVQAKVGWVKEADGWIVNSSGRVLVDDAPVLISVMTDRNASLEAGVGAIEDVARLVGDVVRTRRAAQQKALPFPSSPLRTAAQVD